MLIELILLIACTDVSSCSTQQRRESAVSIVAEHLVTEANIEIHVPRDT